MKIIFFGLGSIGTRHAELLKQMRKADLYAFRSRKNGNRLGIKDVFSWQEVDKIKPDIAFITNPTSMHIDTALNCAGMNMRLFIEKPVGSSTKGLDKLLGIVKSKKIAAYVAYVLRFHPVIAGLRQYLKKDNFLHMRIAAASNVADWRKSQNYLESYSARKAMGGGVVLDLSHEIDYADYLSGGIKSICGRFGKRGNVTLDAEDYADMFISSEKGPIDIHINFLSNINQRIVQIDFKDKSVVGDLLNYTIEEFRSSKLIRKIKFKKEDPYKKQLQYFFANIGNNKMMNNLPDASRLFRKIIEFKQKAGNEK